MHVLHLGIIINALVLAILGSSNGSQIEEEIINRVLKNYNPKFRPPPPGGVNATTVVVSLYVRKIDYIDDVKMEYSVQLTFRQRWRDLRLAYTQEDAKRQYITFPDPDKIWTPDLFFGNERSGHTHNLLKPNRYIRVFPDGEVLYSLRLTLVLACPMILKAFPLDKQTCSIRMASYGFNTDDIIFEWTKDDPVLITPELHILNFDIEQFAPDKCDSHTNTGIYSCLRVDILFSRYFRYFLIHFFIPSITLIIMSWLSFWLSKTEVIGRLLLTLVTIFMMVLGIQIMNYNSRHPVSYLRLMDVWNGWCLIFVLIAFLEFILVNFLARMESPSPDSIRKNDEGWTIRKCIKNLTWADVIDIAARILYPIAFMIFFVPKWGPTGILR